MIKHQIDINPTEQAARLTCFFNSDFELPGVWIQHWLQGGYKQGTPNPHAGYKLSSQSQSSTQITTQGTAWLQPALYLRALV